MCIFSDIVVILITLIYTYLFWFTPELNRNFLKCTGDCNAFFVLQRNNPDIFAININNTLEELTPLLYLHISCMSARSKAQILSR